MEGFMYPASLVMLISIAFMFYKQNSSFLMLLSLAAAVYIVYIHEVDSSSIELNMDIFQNTSQNKIDDPEHYEEDF